MSAPFGAEAARRAASAIASKIGIKPRVGLILGSGLGGIAGLIENPVKIPYRDVPGFPAATVVGHAGELIGGTLSGVAVVALSGRFHMYEGHDVSLAAFPARVMHALGVTTLIVSNASGGVKTSLPGGTLMLINDHVNLMFRNPLIGPVEPGDERFPDMSEPYDAELRELARTVAREQNVPIAEGVYFGLLGPSYETRAEVRMLARLGADAVGMSTVPEVIVARTLGLRVLGFSCITNLACGLSDVPITHADVIATTTRVADQMQRLVRGVVARL